MLGGLYRGQSNIGSTSVLPDIAWGEGGGGGGDTIFVKRRKIFFKTNFQI